MGLDLSPAPLRLVDVGPDSDVVALLERVALVADQLRILRIFDCNIRPRPSMERSHTADEQSERAEPAHPMPNAPSSSCLCRQHRRDMVARQATRITSQTSPYTCPYAWIYKRLCTSNTSHPNCKEQHIGHRGVHFEVAEYCQRWRHHLSQQSGYQNSPTAPCVTRNTVSSRIQTMATRSSFHTFCKRNPSSCILKTPAAAAGWSG